MKPFVSVLTPVYNGEKYLEECIKSVLSQTYDNWEYVIVNNCSTDNSREIAEKYAGQDKRIKVHNNEKHLKLMDNLNNAFSHISGESRYCKVVHADDFIMPECIAKMVDVAERYPSVGLVSSYRLHGNKIDLCGLPYGKECFDGSEIARTYLLGKGGYFGSPSSILLRSDVIRERNEFYNPEHIHSDLSACLEILKKWNFGFVHQVLTHTRLHDQSVTETVVNKYDTNKWGRIRNLLDFGPHFLGQDEYEKRFDLRMKICYRSMARAILRGQFENKLKRDLDYFKRNNIPINYFELTKGLVVELNRLTVDALRIA